MSNGKRLVEGPGIRWERREYSYSGVQDTRKRFHIKRIKELDQALDEWLLRHDQTWLEIRKHEYGRNGFWKPLCEKVVLYNKETSEEMLGTVLSHPCHGEVISWDKGTPPVNPAYRQDWVIKKNHL